jgi:hypothetical protein
MNEFERQLDEYVRIFNKKLLTAFKQLTVLDFTNIRGFSELKYATPEMRNFHQVRNTLEYMVKHEILNLDYTSQQAFSFKRWLAVADRLLTAGNYDGFFIVMLSLNNTEISKLQLDKFLSRNERKLFKKYSEFVHEPQGKFRKYVSRNADNERLPCFELVKHDLIGFNEALNPPSEAWQALNDEQKRVKRLAGVSVWKKEKLLWKLRTQQTGEAKYYYSSDEKRFQHYNLLCMHDSKKNELWRLNKISSRRLQDLGVFSHKHPSPRNSVEEINWVKSQKSQQSISLI